jgi:6-hydroxycyclohex-1-ene-1-carbonyl-CoA dehydrogenase
MTDVPDKIIAWQLTPSDADGHSDGTFPESLVLATMSLPKLKPGQVLVEIAGSCLCRRDLSGVADGGRRISSLDPGQYPPFDIAGRVVAGEAAWLGREVLIPAFAPGRYHGLASHVPVSIRNLLEIKCRKAFAPLAHLSAAIDALAVPFQVAARARIAPGDKVIVLGLGGDGPFLVQIAKAFGADTVVAVDTSKTRLNGIVRYGADRVVNAKARSPEEVIAQAKHCRHPLKYDGLGWKVLITPGPDADLRTVLELADQPDTLTMVGSAAYEQADRRDTLLSVRVEVIESCGCPAKDYPGLVERVTAGTIELSPFLLTRPMSWAKQVLSPSYDTISNTRIVFTPDDFNVENSLEARSCR